MRGEHFMPRPRRDRLWSAFAACDATSVRGARLLRASSCRSRRAEAVEGSVSNNFADVVARVGGHGPDDREYF